MSSNLSPVISERLAAFGKRWQQLVLFRGLSEGVVALLGSMTLVAILDWLFIMPEWLRWTLSGLGYLGTALVVWLNCVRPLLRAPSPRELARLLEKARPDLREDLISAVELGEVKPENQWDSPVFRKLLQEDVANRVRDLKIDQLLPNKLISRWLGMAVGVIAGCAALLLIPELHYDQLMARAFAPLADLERVSSVKIKIIEPKQASGPAPRGDNLDFVVEISGAKADKVALETFRPDGTRDHIIMNADGEHRFRTSIPVEADNLEYRVRAGDAMTRRYLIQTRPRPHVASFEKTYHFPAYSRLANKTVKEENGDLSALEGTEAELLLHVDQPILQGELRLELAGRQNTVPLESAGANLMKAKVPVQAVGTYSVHLVAAQTGFDNKFSPQYEVRPIPDLIPTVRIESPTKDTVVQADEVVNLLGAAKDDFSLASVTQMSRLNNDPWVETPLMNAATNEVNISRAWDLLPLKAKPGDQITTKLVAMDLKGNRGESMPLRLVVSSPGFDLKRLRALEAKQHLEIALRNLNKAAGSLREAVVGKDAKNIKNGEDLQRQQSVMAAQSAVETVEHELTQSEASLKEAMSLSAPGRESSDLALVGRVMSEIKNEPVAHAKAQLELIGKENADTPNKPEFRAASEAVYRAADLTANTELAYKDILASDHAGLIDANLNYLGSEQQRMNKMANSEANSDPLAWDRLSRRESGATQEIKLLEDLVKSLTPQIPGQFTSQTKKSLDAIVTARMALEKHMTNGPASKAILTPTGNLQKSIENTLANFQPLERELALRADKAREKLSRLAGDSFAEVQKVRKEAEELAETERKIKENEKKAPKTAEKLQAKAQEQREKLEADWKAATEELKDRARIEEQRRDTDPQFVQDATKTAEALAAQRAANAANPETASSADALKQLEKSLQTLEASHQLTEASTAVKLLATQERWEAKDLDAGIKRPKDWNWTDKALQETANDIKNAGLPESAAKAVTDTMQSPAAQQVAQEMNARQNQQRAPVSMANNLEDVKKGLNQAQQQLQPAVDAARSAVANAAPALSDMMKGLARAAEKMENTTKETADKTKATDPEAAQNDAHKLLNEQQELNKQIQDLSDALRRDANVQDITNKDGRERARDADDAVAMLREPPAKAEDALREASMAKETPRQQQALAAAATQQRKTSDTLKQLAAHYQNLDAGKAADSRLALRAAEDDLGIKSNLDAEYNKAEALATLSKQSPEEMLAQLERELPQNQTMQKELGNIADQTLDAARQNLQNSANLEKSISHNLNDLAKAQSAKDTLAAKAQKLAADANKLAQDVPDIRQNANASEANANPELDRAAQSLQAAANQVPKDMSQSPEATAQKISDLVPNLDQAKKDLQATADKAAETLKKVGPTDPKAASALAAKDKAAKAADQAQKLADQARTLASNLENLSRSSAQEMSSAAAQQKPIANDVLQAAADLERAGRHESRLGTPQGQALEAVGKETKAVAENHIPETQNALMKDNQNPAEAAKAVDKTKNAVEDQLKALQSALAKADKNTAPAETTDKAMLAAQAQKLADQARQMADQQIPEINKAATAAKANVQPELNQASQKMQQVAKQAPTDTDHAAEAAKQMADLVRPLQQAQAQLAKAAAKAPASSQAQNQAQQAAQQAGQMADQAQQMADTLAKAAAQQAAQSANANTPDNGTQQMAQLAAQKLAEQAQRMANQDIPAIKQDAQNAKANVAPELDQAGQKMQQAATQAANVGQNGNTGQQMANLVAPLEQAQAQLNQAANKAPNGSTAQTKAQQAAQQAGQMAAQAKAAAQALGANNNSDMAAKNGTEAGNATAKGQQGKPGEQASTGKNGSDAAAQASTKSAQQANAAAQGNQAGQAANPNPQLAMLDQISQMTPPTPEESMWKARTLDQLDAALHPVEQTSATSPSQQGQQGQNGQQGKQNSQQGQQGQQGQQQSANANSNAAQQAASQAMSDAAQAQKSSMMASRNTSNSPGRQGPKQAKPGSSPVGGEFGDMGPEGEGMLPEVRALRTGDWGKLPPKVAEGLMDARRENMPGEYRAMVETYFRVIAEKARDKK